MHCSLPTRAAHQGGDSVYHSAFGLTLVVADRASDADSMSSQPVSHTGGSSSSTVPEHCITDLSESALFQAASGSRQASMLLSRQSSHSSDRAVEEASAPATLDTQTGLCLSRQSGGVQQQHVVSSELKQASRTVSSNLAERAAAAIALLEAVGSASSVVSGLTDFAELGRSKQTDEAV